MVPLRTIRRDDSLEAAQQPIQDVVQAPGIPREKRIGRRVEEEFCFVSDETLSQALQPALLNGGNLVDVFQKREDDFEAVEPLEVWYATPNGEVRELVFVDSTKTGPRILVAASRVNNMHRAISVLARKVDNLTTTLRVCRSHYYKELFSLRHGREPMEEHEKFWFMPQNYQDTVSIQELRARFGSEQEELRKKEQEIRQLKAKLSQIDSIAEERVEQIVTRKMIPELFRWMKYMNDFREAEFNQHLQLLGQELAKQEALEKEDEDSEPVVDLEKVRLKNRAENAEMEVDTLRQKLQEAQVAQDALTKLLTDRRAEIPHEFRAARDGITSEDSVSFFASESPLPSKEPPSLEDVRARRRSLAEEMFPSVTSYLDRPPLRPETEGSPADAEAKSKQLQGLADAWEKEAKDMARKNIELQKKNKEMARIQKQRDIALKEVKKANEQREVVEKELVRCKQIILELKQASEGTAQEGDSGAPSSLPSRRASTVRQDLKEQLDMVREIGSKGRLNLPTAPQSRHLASPTSGSQSRDPTKDNPRGRRASTKEETTPRRRASEAGNASQSQSPVKRRSSTVQDLSTSEKAAAAPQMLSPTRRASKTMKAESPERTPQVIEVTESNQEQEDDKEEIYLQQVNSPEGSPGSGDSKEELLSADSEAAEADLPGGPGPPEESIHLPTEEPPTAHSFRNITPAKMSLEFSLGLGDFTHFNSQEVSSDMRDASVQTLITVGVMPPRWVVWPGYGDDPEDGSLQQLLAGTKSKVLQWCVQYIKVEEPDILKSAAAMAAVEKRAAAVRRAASPPAPKPKEGEGSKWSKAVQRMNTLRLGKLQKISAMDEERKQQIEALPPQPPPKPVRMNKPGGLRKMVAAAAATTARRWIHSPSGASICRVNQKEPGLPRLLSTSEAPTLSLMESQDSTLVFELPPEKDETEQAEARDWQLQVNTDHAGPPEARAEARSVSHEPRAWPRQVTAMTDAESSLSEREKSGSFADAEWTQSRHSRDSQLSDQEHEHRYEGMSDHLEELPRQRRQVQVAMFQRTEIGSNLYTAPLARNFKASEEEPWSPQVAQGGFTALDSVSLIAGQLDRFQEDFEEHT
ncbi:unnamed protein product [Effrenium voratum]|uniref:Uncharacterized protein n=1 Tax=Effrenium voratum TaxID=2562239 RepID=A0AA36J6G0_9DINO|nr:unnamed protein product [Effrenium voratum]